MESKQGGAAGVMGKMKENMVVYDMSKGDSNVSNIRDNINATQI